MTEQPNPTPLGWADHRTRTVALNAWLAREEAVASGAAVATDPVQLGLPDRETLLRTLFQRFATTLEGVLDAELELDGHSSSASSSPYTAVRAAYRRTAAHRPVDWRALHREAADPVVADLVRRQQGRIARRSGVTPLEVAAIAADVARAQSTTIQLAGRARRRRVAPRVLARRAG